MKTTLLHFYQYHNMEVALNYLVSQQGLLLIAALYLCYVAIKTYFTWILFIISLLSCIGSFYMITTGNFSNETTKTIIYAIYTSSYIFTAFFIIKMILNIEKVFVDIIEFIILIFTAIIQSIILSILWVFEYMILPLFKPSSTKSNNANIHQPQQAVHTSQTNTSTTSSNKKNIPKGNYTTVYTSKGKEIIIEAKHMDSGGEAFIHNLYNANKLAKIFKDTCNLNAKYESILKLINIKMPNCIVMPQELIFDKNKQFIGYQMDKVKGIELGVLLLKGNRKKYFPNYTVKDLVDMSITIIDAYSSLHKQQIIACDVNFRNILVNSSKEVYIIDADSFQVDKPSSAGMIEYQKHSRHGYKFGTYMRNIDDDTYAIQVVVFQILHYGGLPYGSTNIDDIKALNFELNPKNKHIVSSFKPEVIKSYHNLSYELRVMFYEIFKNLKNISISDFKESLLDYRQQLN